MIFDMILRGYPRDCVNEIEKNGFYFYYAVEGESIGLYRVTGNRKSSWVNSKRVSMLSCSEVEDPLTQAIRDSK